MKRFVWDFLDSNIYLFEEKNHILVIDPIDTGAALDRFMYAASVTVILTHEHFDHISGLNRLRNFRSTSGNVIIKDGGRCQVVANECCSERIQDAKTNLSAYADVLAVLSEKSIPENWSPFTCKAADITFKKSYYFQWMGHIMELFYTPGHSAGSICIVVDGDKLFAGDSILESGLMVKFPGSSKELYREVSVPLMEKLLYQVDKVYPGHGDVMTGEEALKIIRSV